VIAVGDLSFNGGYGRRRDNPLRGVLDEWRSADLRLGNLESPLTEAPRASPGKLTLRGAERAPAFLREAGFDALTLANNHVMDYGPGGLADTCARLADAGLPHHGAGSDESAARAPLILHRQGQSIGILAYCAVEQKSPLYAGPGRAGAAALEIDACLRDIRNLRPRVDWLIVQAHWGPEMAQFPSPEQRACARRFVEAGADLVLGHHPHVLQPLEWIDGVPVFYSLGNCLFSGMYWRGRNSSGEPFVSHFRLHPLSRQTGWAEVRLRRGEPTEARLRPAFLRKNLRLVPHDTATRRSAWQGLGAQLDRADYESAYRAELEQARKRLAWQEGWQSLERRLALLLFRKGLLPLAVEGT
jgi:hypothetical protein